MSEKEPKRLVVFGATGHLGQQLIEKLADEDWPISELIGVASGDSAGTEFEFRGEHLDVVSEWPVLKGRDLVFICTPPAEALEVVREALRAEVPCIDCTGALASQPEVPMPGPSSTEHAGGAVDPAADAPLLLVASGTTLAWAPILEALSVTRALGTVLCSASALGQKGVVALSEESISLFNQSSGPEGGPAGQPVAFDAIPGGGIDCDRVRAECQRLLGQDLRIDLTSIQVPTFIGEGSSLVVELREPLDGAAVEARLEATRGVTVVRDSLGSRGLVAVEESSAPSIGPTLRDAIGSDEILVGRIAPDQSLSEGLGWRLWLSCDPLRLTADQALRLAKRRLGLA